MFISVFLTGQLLFEKPAFYPQEGRRKVGYDKNRIPHLEPLPQAHPRVKVGSEV